MLILKINNKKASEVLDDATRAELTDHGVIVEDLEPSPMSFLTAMRIASLCKKHTPSLVMAYSIVDAMGAISARELTRKRSDDFKVAFRVTSRMAVPRSIPKAVRKGIDTWIFDSENSREAWHGLVVGCQTCTIARPEVMFHVEHTTDKDIDATLAELVFIGKMDKAANLSKMVDAMANLEPEQRPAIRVSGTGKARYVMPVVKKSRLMNLDITWLGDDFDLTSEIARADGFIVSDHPYSPDELQALSAGVPPVNASNLAEWTDTANRTIMAQKAAADYADHHAPAAVASQFKDLLK